MENEVTILTWINGWREANGLSAEDVLSEEQAKLFIAGFKQNFEFKSEITANTLIYSENGDEEQLAVIKEKYEEGTFAVINEFEELKLINSEEFKTAVSSAVGEEWFERLYNGETVEDVTTGVAFEGELSIKDYVYGEIVKNSTATEIVALVADDAYCSIWNRTIFIETLLNEKVETINGVSKDDIISLASYCSKYLGYSTLHVF